VNARCLFKLWLWLNVCTHGSMPHVKGPALMPALRYVTLESEEEEEAMVRQDGPCPALRER